MPYVILIRYRTGDSLGLSDETSELEFLWNSLEAARENLIRIRDHHKLYNEVNSYSYIYSNGEDKRVNDLVKKAKKEPWFVSGKNYGTEKWTSYLNLKLDDGTEHEFYAFWTGHFETLHGADIVTKSVSDNDIMSFDT